MTDIRSLFMLAAGSVLTISCTMNPGKSDLTPDYDIPMNYSAERVHVYADTLMESQWWRGLNNSELNDLIDTMLIHNLDLELAHARVSQVEAFLRQTQTQQLPTFSAESSVSLSHGSAYMAGSSFPIDKDTTYSFTAGMNWELDIWGRIRSLKNAAVSDLAGVRWNTEALYQGLIAQTVLLYFEIQSRVQYLELAGEMERINSEDLELQNVRYMSGVGSRLNIARAQQALAVSVQQRIQEEYMLSSALRSLNVLLGRYPDDTAIQQTSRPAASVQFNRVPAGLPSDLLIRRPDIRAAESNVEAARQRVGAARADLFPRLALTGSAGHNNTMLEDLLAENSRLLTAGSSVSSVFAFGAKKAVVRQNQAALDQAVLEYQKAVLDAFREVESAIEMIRISGEQLTWAQNQLKAAEDVLRFQNQKYARGIGRYDQVLDARLSRHQARTGLITAENTVIQSHVNLYLSLGGDWK